MLPPLAVSSRSWDGSSALERSIVSLQEKLRITLVSRLWNLLATPLLYEHLLIRNPQTLSSIVAFSAYHKASTGSLFRFTRRLELIYIPHALRHPSDDTVRELSGLLSACFNLCVLRISMGHDWTSGSPSLISAFQGFGTVRYISWEDDWISEPLFMWFHSFSALEVLKIHPVMFLHSPGDMRTNVLSFPRLHTLIVHDNIDCAIFRAVSRWDVPVLMRLVLGYERVPVEVPSDLFEKFASKVRYLDIADALWFGDNHFAHKCINLLALRVSASSFWDSVGTPHPTLAQVLMSIKVHQRQSGDDTLDWFEIGMSTLFKMRGSQLGVMCVVDLEHDLFHHVEVRKWIDTWAKEDLMLEDASGDLFSECAGLLM
jgi:hypothetical protein